MFPHLKNFLKSIILPKIRFKSSRDYWNSRYLYGGNSGSGSYGKIADFKAKVINDFIRRQKIEKAIEFGCGDGNQLKYLNFHSYVGYDVSKEAIKKCSKMFRYDSSKQFRLIDDYLHEKVDLTVSLEVIFHLVEDNIYHDYMDKLFSSSNRFVIIFSSNTETNEISNPEHVRHRKFTNWINKNNIPFKLHQKILNKYPYKKGDKDTSFSDFYIFERESEKLKYN